MTFAEEFVEQDSEFFCLDIDSLFTNTTLEETIDICAKNTKVGLSKIEFKELLSLATKVSCFIFNGKLYKQVNRVTEVQL